MCFGRATWRHRWKRAYQVALIVYVGFISGDLIAQSLVAGWAKSGIPWSTAPGLTLLVAASFLVPAATRKPLYCHHLCPHGAAQELLGHYGPARWRIQLPPGLVRGLEYLPGALLLVVLLVVMLALPLELAGLEPFDAYLIRNAGFATIAVAVVGLIASLFVPQAYCRFGCPTGALLNFVRARGPTDRFTRRDFMALLFVGLAAVLNWQALPLARWVTGVE
jgi:polyferredoxin